MILLWAQVGIVTLGSLLALLHVKCANNISLIIDANFAPVSRQWFWTYRNYILLQMFAIFKIQKYELSKIDFTVEKMHFYKITDLNYESHPIKMFAISVR